MRSFKSTSYLRTLMQYLMEFFTVSRPPLPQACFADTGIQG